MADQKRGVISEPHVLKFKGINKYLNIAAVGPDHALDLLNVICSTSGGLHKLRQPKPIVNPSAVSGGPPPVVNTGTGVDGARTFDGAATILGLVPVANEYTLTRDINLAGPSVVNLGVKIRTAGFKIYCSGTLTNNGTIYNNGGDGGVGGNAFWPQSHPGGAAGRNWRVGIATQATSAGAINNQNVVNGKLAHRGGTGGTGVYGTLNGTPTYAPHVPGSGDLGGGAGGGGNGGQGPLAAGGCGGAGGGGAGWAGDVFVAVNKLVNNGIISANGGNGGNGGNCVDSGGGLSGAAQKWTAVGNVQIGGGGGGGGAGAGGDGGTVEVGVASASTLGTIVANAGVAGIPGLGGLSADGLTRGSDGGAGEAGINGVVTITLGYALGPADGIFTGTCYGLFDFQQPNGTRQMVAIFGQTIYYIPSQIDGSWGAAVVIDTNAANAHFWSAVPSNHILFMANGYRMLKWTGTNLWKWGIESLFGGSETPSTGEPVPTITGIAGGGNITLGTGRKYRAAVYNSVTDTLGTASDASASSGPCDSSKITVQIDVTAQAAADAQIDTVRWYATLDNGVIYYFHSDVAVNRGGPTVLVDNLPDPETGGEIFQPSSTLLANPGNQQPQTGGVWEYVVFGNPQWRTVGGPNPAVGDLPWMYAHNFAGMNVPASATIVGIAVNFQASSQSATTSFIDKVGLYYQGKQIGTLKTPGVTPIPTAITNYSFGSDSDDWGANLTPAKVNDQSFGFGVELDYTNNAAGQRLFMYEFGIIVYYQIPQDNSVTLNLLEQAQLINDPPPVGKYLASWGERIYIAGIVGFPQDVVYSGYEQILDGRPEEAFPPGNRLRLAVGADWIRGMGKVQAGLVIGSKSNEMFMFRGDVEDVVTGTPLSFTEVLETLPFATAFASHYAIVSSPEGLVFLSAQRSIDGYTGTGRPSTMSHGIAPIMRDIAVGLQEACQGIFYNFLDKDWYVLAIPSTAASTTPDKLIVIDLDEDQNSDEGIFIFDIGAFDVLSTVEDPISGRQMLIVVQGGIIKEIKPIISGNNDIPSDTTVDNTVNLPAYWRSGYFGAGSGMIMHYESPQAIKLFRYANIIAGGQLPVSAIAYLVDDRNYTYANPKAIPATTLFEGGKAGINWKGRRASIQIVFPTPDTEICVNELWVSRISLSER